MKHAPSPRLIDRDDDISLDILMIAACGAVVVAALIYLLAI